MNKSFILLDKTSNLQKKADAIIKFNYESKDYLIYSIDENEQNKQIFTSKLTSNSEGKFFIENLLEEEKNRLNNIVYNIVILTPTEYKKGNEAKVLIDNLVSKFYIKLSKNMPELGVQEYYNKCSIAITSNQLVQTALDFYEAHLEEDNASLEIAVPTWTVPIESKDLSKDDNSSAPTKQVLSQEVSTSTELNINLSTLNTNENKDVKENVLNSEINNMISKTEDNKLEDFNYKNINISNQVSDFNPPTSDVNLNETIMPINNREENDNLPNPQKEKLAIISDPSLSSVGIDTRSIQPNALNNKKAGFATNKYVIIGTICLVLAIVVVVVAYFLIKNIK